MSFNGTEGSAINESAAADLTANYRQNNPNQTKAVFIGADNILALLRREGSKGIRVYFGKEDGGANTIVMVSAIANEDDDLGLIMDCGQKCPPHCGKTNSLNS